MQPEAQQIVEKLGLQPHPEGGFYRETFRSDLKAATEIYFLLPAGTFSAFHTLKSDEIWHFYAGDALNLYIISPEGDYQKVRLGSDVLSGEMPQVIVPAGFLQAAEQIGERFTLCGCTVAPAFEFSDFEIPARRVLTEKFPQHRALFERFSQK